MAVFLVRAFDLVNPGVLTLFRESSNFFNPVFEEVPFPYSSNSVVSATVSGIPMPTTYSLDTFKLVAEGRTFTLTNITATDATGQVVPFVSGIAEGTQVVDGGEVILELVSPLTRGATVQLTFGFEVLESGDTFVANYTFTSN
jgi:hypothetical protein